MPIARPQQFVAACCLTSKLCQKSKNDRACLLFGILLLAIQHYTAFAHFTVFSYEWWNTKTAAKPRSAALLYHTMLVLDEALAEVAPRN